VTIESGHVLGQRYRLVERIAVGGMGEVWVATDLSLGRKIAIKVLKEEFAGDTAFLERFRTEALNAAALSHRNIAQLFDYGEQDGSAYLVMELIEGEPMSDLLDRTPILPVELMLTILAQVARGLHAAHVAGVVHRDIKPGNILLAKGNEVKITDFGVSLASNQIPMTATGMVMGTAQYLSPEQAIGHAATPASDLYSMGIIAYECLVGHRPFTGPTAVDIAVAHVNTPVPPLPGTIDPALADLVMRLLSKEPSRRPRSAGSLARTLEAMIPPRQPPLEVLGEPTVRPEEAPPVRLGGGSSAPSPARIPPMGGGDIPQQFGHGHGYDSAPVQTPAQPSAPQIISSPRQPADPPLARPTSQTARPVSAPPTPPLTAPAPGRSARRTTWREAGLRLRRPSLVTAALVLLLVGLLGAWVAQRVLASDSRYPGTWRGDMILATQAAPGWYPLATTAKDS